MGNGKYAFESMACTVNTGLSGSGGSRKLYYPEIHRGTSHFTILSTSSTQSCYKIQSTVDPQIFVCLAHSFTVQ